MPECRKTSVGLTRRAGVRVTLSDGDLRWENSVWGERKSSAKGRQKSALGFRRRLLRVLNEKFPLETGFPVTGLGWEGVKAQCFL